MKPRWQVTKAAAHDYMRVRGWPEHEGQYGRVVDELSALAGDPNRAMWRAADRCGRQLYRTGNRDGSMRLVVDPTSVPGDDRPRLVWCGCGRPPGSVWEPSGT